MKKIILLYFVLLSFLYLNIENIFALQITKVSGPKTSPWIELLNDSDSIKNIKDLKLYTKSATNTSTHSVSLGNKATNFDIQPNSYFILADDPSKTIFLNLNCQVFDTSFDLVIGQTISYDVLDYQVLSADTLSSTSCGTGSVDNSTSTNSTSTNSGNSTSTTNIVYVYIPSVLLPEEKIIPAGADVDFNVKAVDKDKKAIFGLDFAWSFGDGGEKFGQKVSHHYTYPGEYTLVASADGYTVGGEARMNVLVITPDISILKVGKDLKENFIDLKNNTEYDLILSDFYLNIDNIFYKLPKNFTILKGKTVHVSGEAVGFKLPATKISLNYPNKNLLLSYFPISDNLVSTTSSTSLESNEVNKKSDLLSEVLDEKIIKPKYEDSGIFVDNKNNSNIKNTHESFILKKLILDNKKNEVQEIQAESKSVNLNKTDNVDTGIVDWFKSLIY